MKFFINAITVLIGVLLVNFQVFGALTKVVPIKDVELSERYSEPETPVVSATVVYRSGCYEAQLQKDKLGEEGQTITLKHVAEITQEYCTMAIEQHRVFFDLNGYEPGLYQLVDGFDQKPLANVRIDENGQHEVIHH
ncbi:MAG: hypothetical protein R2827_13780 [Bdellovibrionales bacterium]